MRWYDNDNLGPVILRPPYYALALWKRAVRARSRMLPAAVAPGARPVEGLKVRLRLHPRQLSCNCYFLLCLSVVRSVGTIITPTITTHATHQVWPLWGEDEKELRVVIINKRPLDAVNATLRLDKPGGFGAASITRLVAQGDRPLEARGGAISLGGITYVLGGEARGSPVAEAAPRFASGGRLAWTVYMPPGSAALVVIKRLW